MTRHSPFALLVTLIIAALSACASGSAIVTGAVRAPISPAHVTLYLEPPPEFEVIGLVNASSSAGWTEQGSIDYAIQELKDQAAKLGANGVLLVASGERTTTALVASGGVLYPVPINAKTVQGRAIFVKSK